MQRDNELPNVVYGTNAVQWYNGCITAQDRNRVAAHVSWTHAIDQKTKKCGAVLYVCMKFPGAMDG